MGPDVGETEVQDAADASGVVDARGAVKPRCVVDPGDAVGAGQGGAEPGVVCSVPTTMQAANDAAMPATGRGVMPGAPVVSNVPRVGRTVVSVPVVLRRASVGHEGYRLAMMASLRGRVAVMKLPRIGDQTGMVVAGAVPVPDEVSMMDRAVGDDESRGRALRCRGGENGGSTDRSRGPVTMVSRPNVARHVPLDHGGSRRQQVMVRPRRAAARRADVARHGDRPRRPDPGGHSADDELEHAALQGGGGHETATRHRSRGGAAGDRAGDHKLLQGDAGADGEQNGQLAPLTLDLLAELAAARALAQMTAQIAPPQRAAAERGQLLADLGAVGLARGAAGDQ
jgi:hypothetical protein